MKFPGNDGKISEGTGSLASAYGKRRVAVIGGGASGLMAAYSAAACGHFVCLFEKNEKLGKKIYITGKGRCNVTNDCPPDEFLPNVVHGGKFLTGTIYAFPPSRLMQFLEENGVPLKVERGNRVFPVSDHASSVTAALERACRAAGVHIFLGKEVKGVCVEEGRVKGVFTAEGLEPFDAAIVATGGLTYPSTGSTGDGYRFAAEAGHTVVPCSPSLTGLELEENLGAAQGITLKNVVLSSKKNGFSRLGELLITHYGISGPLALSLSAYLAREGNADAEIDFKPALSDEILDMRILRDVGTRAKEQMKNIMRGLLPAPLCLIMLERAKILPTKRGSELTKEERARLVHALKHFRITVKGLRGYAEAVITSGGVELKEIDPKTMESKLVRGLHLCGEVLDVDALTGGFNLQIAFSTGFAAGKGIK